MTPRQFVKSYPALLSKHGSQRRVANALQLPRSTLQDWLRKQGEILFSERSPPRPIVNLKPRSGVRRWIFSSAQDETAVHEGFLANLIAYRDHLRAELVVSGFTYNKRLYTEHNPEKRFYDPLIEPFLCNRPVAIGDGLVFCGEMNTLPTATQPLAGFETYTRDKWGIFPHAKVQLASVATMKDDPAKQIMTTGALTLPNYVPMRAGIRAHFHHQVGAVLVELDEDGDFFCRHLLADSDGSFQDLTTRVENGVVTTGHRVEAITWGDLHTEKLDPVVRETCWGIDADGVRIGRPTMLDALKPHYQFLHDSTDFSARNSHNVRDPHFLLRTMFQSRDSVEQSMTQIAGVLDGMRRPWCETVVVESNHDLQFMRWLKETDWRSDPVNAEYHLEAQLHLIKQIKAGKSDPSMFQWAMLRANHYLDELVFLREDDTFKICGDIECGMHGHLGANGAKGTPRQFARMGSKANTAHVHAPSIVDGIYTAGTSSRLEMDYNRGLSSWAHAHTITYPSGKRAIISLRKGKWAAGT